MADSADWSSKISHRNYQILQSLVAQIADLSYAAPARHVGGGNLRRPRLGLISLLALLLTCFRAEAEEGLTAYEKDFGAAKQSILEGHVKDGIGQMAALVAKIDPTQEPNNYWFLCISVKRMKSPLLANSKIANLLRENCFV